MYTDFRFQDITEKIIGASFEVHNFLGNGFQEVIYQRALYYELQQAGSNFKRELVHEIYYKDIPTAIGKRRADFVVEGKVLVELKARPQIEDSQIAQTLGYLKAYNLKVGLLINFGSKSLTVKRLVLG